MMALALIHSVASSFMHDLPMRISREWLIRWLVLTSMSVQIVMVVFGARRHKSSNRYLRFIVWVAYIVADSVAISALSTMTQSVRSRIHGIWAPLLLLHLGGPDAITAFSMADNELWLRHGFTMVYQVLVAVYVMAVSGIEGYLLAAALLLFFAGATKYAERTVALLRASYSQIVNSCLPVYKFMQNEADMAVDLNIDRDECSYLVTGEKQLYKKLLELQSQDERKGFNNRKSLLKADEIVTINDVWEHEGRKATNNYILCLSYALFKMYKRRFVSLYFHEGDRRKTRKFFMGGTLTSDEVFRIAEMELRFMYDVLFSKSSGTAYSGFGVLLRLFNTCFLGMAGFLTFRGGKDNLLFKHAQGTVTSVLIWVAIVVELYQLVSIIVSDWTMVFLICREIQHLRLRLGQVAMRTVLLLRKVGGDHYWKNKIGQYCVFDACSDRFHCIWNVAECFGMQNSIVMQWYVKAKYTKAVPVEDNFKTFVFDKLKERCSPDETIGTCRQRVYAYDRCFSDMGCDDLVWASELELEELILTWHLATVICAHEAGRESNAAHCETISRYCAYLLISQPQLLPLHADIAKMSYMELHFEILKHKDYTLGDWKSYKTRGKTTLKFGTKLARKLLSKPPETRWNLLGEFWAGLLIYIAVYNKGAFHAECLTSGGEFVTQLWLLIGHMGCGEQSDSAVTKKIEDKSNREKEEEDRIRKRETDKKRGEEKRRIVEGLRGI